MNAKTDKKNMGDVLTASNVSGRNIGKYQILESMGEGGFANVYKVYDPDLQVLRALKQPSGYLDEKSAVLEEARIQAKLHHPSIIQVFSVEKIDGRWIIVMEFAENGNLRSRLQNGKAIPVEHALRHLIALTDAVQFAHENGILHNDIKPENILFAEDETIKLADFGIARRMQVSFGEQSGKLQGTVSYIAPEQFRGDSDARSDIWSLGAVSYEMLTGKRCFSGKADADIVQHIFKEQPMSPRDIRPDMPRHLERIVMRMLEKNPDDRYQSADEVIRDLEKCRDMQESKKRTWKRWVVLFLLMFFPAAGGFLYATKMLPDSFVNHITGIIHGEKILPQGILSKTPHEQFVEAKKEIDAGQYQLAADILGHLITHSDDEQIVQDALHVRAGVFLHKMNLPDPALRDYEDLIARFPESPYRASAHFFSGLIYSEKMHDPRQARIHLKTVLMNYSDSPVANTAKLMLEDIEKQLPVQDR